MNNNLKESLRSRRTFLRVLGVGAGGYALKRTLNALGLEAQAASSAPKPPYSPGPDMKGRLPVVLKTSEVAKRAQVSFEFEEGFPAGERARLGKELPLVASSVEGIFGPPRVTGAIKVYYDSANEFFGDAGAWGPDAANGRPAGGILVSWNKERKPEERIASLGHELGHIIVDFPPLGGCEFLGRGQLDTEEHVADSVGHLVLDDLGMVTDLSVLAVHIRKRDGNFFRRFSETWRGGRLRDHDRNEPMPQNEWRQVAERVSPGFGIWYDRMQGAYYDYRNAENGKFVPVVIPK